MLNSIRDITAILISGVVILVGLLIFFMVTLSGSELSFDNFDSELDFFIKCESDYENQNELFSTYTNENIMLMNVDSLANMRIELDKSSSCNSDFVISSDDQIRIYAEATYDFIITTYPNENLTLLDAVYTAPSSYYTYTGIPQDYLFFAMDQEGSIMMAFIFDPKTESATQLWTIEEADDFDVVEKYSNNILVKYFEKALWDLE